MNQTTKRSKELKEVHVGRNEVGKSVTGISLEAPKYSCIETKQELRLQKRLTIFVLNRQSFYWSNLSVVCMK